MLIGVAIGMGISKQYKPIRGTWGDIKGVVLRRKGRLPQELYTDKKWKIKV